MWSACFVFKQKTAYEMRISDWSSDVCSSDLPISSKLLDDLILELRDSLGATVVVVTHELASIFAIGDDSVFLDAEAKTMIAQGNPRMLAESCDNPTVRRFLSRCEKAA